MSGSRGGRDLRLLVPGILLAALAAVAVLVLAGLDLLALVMGAAVAIGALLVIVRVLSRSVERERRIGRRRERGLERTAKAAQKRLREHVTATERRLFAQVEAMGWLQQQLGLRHPLPPTRGWAASPDLLVELVRLIDETRPERVLELGSGVSTVVMAARLRSTGRGTLTALEHDPSYAAGTRRELELQGLDDVATVLEAPLTRVRVGETEWTWYDLPEGLSPGVGLLLVDGPPGTTGSLARYPALPLLAGRLAPGAILVLDDAARPDEQEIVKRWQAERPDLEVRSLTSESGAALLVLPGTPTP
jgi:predicted O-methyltransferase YrrM